MAAIDPVGTTQTQMAMSQKQQQDRQQQVNQDNANQIKANEQKTAEVQRQNRSYAPARPSVTPSPPAPAVDDTPAPRPTVNSQGQTIGTRIDVLA